MSTNEFTLIERARAQLALHRPKALVVVAVVSTVALIVSQIVPEVQDFLVRTGAVPYVTLLIVLDIAVVAHRELNDRRVDVSVNQDESMTFLIDALPECRRESVELLEYAGATTLPLIRAIEREGVAVRILVKHPETVEGVQRTRMIATLDTLYDSVFEDSTASFEVRCYRQPYSLRGRKLGSKVLELGWLTPDIKRQTAYGHANPALRVDPSDRQHSHLVAFFDRTFSDLWSAPDTEDAHTVLLRSRTAI